MEKRVVPGNVLGDVRRELEVMYIQAVQFAYPNSADIGKALFLASNGLPMWAAPESDVNAFIGYYSREASKRTPPTVLGSVRLFYPDGEGQTWYVDAIRRQGSAVLIDISRQVADEHMPYERDTVGCNPDGTYHLISNRQVEIFFE